MSASNSDTTLKLDYQTLTTSELMKEAEQRGIKPTFRDALIIIIMKHDEWLSASQAVENNGNMDQREKLQRLRELDRLIEEGKTEMDNMSSETFLSQGLRVVKDQEGEQRNTVEGDGKHASNGVYNKR